MTTFKKIGSALIGRGYRIIPIPSGRKGPVFDGWEKTNATPAHIEKWVQPYVRSDDPKLKGQTGYANGNLGILTEHTPAVDLDILDEDLAREMEAFVTDLLGEAPTRIGRAPKRLLLFRTDAPFRKMTSDFFISEDGEKHRVEVLGAGQQFVAYGIHPDTHKPYQWVSPEDPLSLDADELPTITPEQCQQIIDEFKRRASERGWERKGNKSSSVASVGDSEDDDFMEGIKQRLRITDAEVAEALKHVPDNDDYDRWLMVGMALHHQYDGSDEGLQHWIDWSESADNFDEDALRKRWDASFNVVPGRTPTTFASVLKIAKENRKATETETVASLRERVAACESEAEMIDDITKDIAAAELSDYQLGVITKLVQAKLSKITKTSVTLATAKDAIKQHKNAPVTASSDDELEITLAKRVLTLNYARGAHIKRFAKTFWVYKGGVWRREDDEMVERRVLETIVKLRREDNTDLKSLIARLEESRGDRLNALSSTLLSVMSKMVAQSSEDDPLNLRGELAPRVVNCLNGEVWFSDDGSIEFKDHNPAHLLTSQVRCEFDEFAECPTFDASIRKVFQKADDPEDVIRHFYEVMGYIIQPTRDAAIWMIFKGPGSNGKSFLLSIIAELMGNGAVLAHPLADLVKGAGPHFTDSLPGKLMMLDDDLKKGVLLPDDWLKKLSEAKLVTANPKFGKTFEFISRATPVVLTNNWPSAADLSEGLTRRIMAFESPHRLLPHEKDPSHKKTILAQELPGVLNHLISGFQRFLRRGSRFDVPAECEQSKARLMTNANTMVRFKLSALLEMPGEVVDAAKLYEAYCDWMSHWEASGTRLGRNSFYNALESLGLTRTMLHGKNVFKDIRLQKLEGVDEVPFDDESDGLDDDL